MTIDFQDAVVVDLLQRSLYDRLQSWVMAIENGTDRVIIIYLRRCVAVGQECALTINKTGESSCILAWLGEVEI